MAKKKVTKSDKTNKYIIVDYGGKKERERESVCVRERERETHI